MQTANRVKCVLAVTGLLVCFDLFALSLTAADTRDVIKIMPLGDSITAGDLDGGYRRLLYDLLTQDGIRFAFVGSLTGGRVPDARHEGHSGWRIDQIEDGIAGGWLEAYKPDLVLLHIGTNDIWQNKGANAPARLSWLIDDILSRLPSTRVIVAQILPMTNGASFEAEVMHYNAAIAELVTSKTSRVCMVNLHEVLSAADFVDGVHPKKSGYDKMALTWEPAIRAVIGGEGPADVGYHCGQGP
jgi:lysophospholipase L1-like esterase